MKPGREMDALVEEKVFGNQVFRNAKGGWSVGPPDYYDEAGWSELHNPLPAYSQEIAAAWLVAEKLGAPDGFLLTGENDYNPTEYYCEFQFKGGFGHAPTAPLAICLAALHAVGVPT